MWPIFQRKHYIRLSVWMDMSPNCGHFTQLWKCQKTIGRVTKLSYLAINVDIIHHSETVFACHPHIHIYMLVIYAVPNTM